MDINKEPQTVSTSNSSGTSLSSSSSSSLTNYTNKFEWNCEPFNVLCIFPYVIGFSRECIEIRLLINGNLINSIIMSDIRLVASKVSWLFVLFFYLFDLRNRKLERSTPWKKDNQHPEASFQLYDHSIAFYVLERT